MGFSNMFIQIIHFSWGFHGIFREITQPFLGFSGYGNGLPQDWTPEHGGLLVDAKDGAENAKAVVLLG